MPYHLHFADVIFSATADIQYHVLEDDAVTLTPHLVVDEAYHEHEVDGPWAADANNTYHAHESDAPALVNWVYPNATVHFHFTDPAATFKLIPGLVVSETYHVTEGDVIWATPIVIDDCFHTTSDDDYETGSSVKILADKPPAGDVFFNMPALTAIGYGGGYVSVELPMLEASATGDNSVVADADFDLPRFRARGLGGGTGYGTFPILSAVGTGLLSAVGTTSTTATTLPMLTVSSTGSNSSNSIAQITLPKLRVAATGLVSIIATADIELPNLDIDAEAINGVVGTASGSLGFMTATGIGYTVPTGDVDADLPIIEIEANGTSSTTRYCSVTLEYTR